MRGVRGWTVHGVGRLGGLHEAGVQQTGGSRWQKNCELLVGIGYTGMDLNVMRRCVKTSLRVVCFSGLLWWGVCGRKILLRAPE